MGNINILAAVAIGNVMVGKVGLKLLEKQKKKGENGKL